MVLLPVKESGHMRGQIELGYITKKVIILKVGFFAKFNFFPKNFSFFYEIFSFFFAKNFIYFEIFSFSKNNIIFVVRDPVLEIFKEKQNSESKGGGGGSYLTVSDVRLTI